MKRVLSFIVLFVVFLVSVSFADLPCKMSLVLDKSVYKIGEPINCKIFIKNISKNDLTLNSRLLVKDSANSEGEIYFRLMDAAGNKPKLILSEKKELYSAPLKTLKSNEYIMTKIDLANMFRFENPGEHVVQVVYENNNSDATLPIWVGSLESNLVFFEIKK